MSRYFYFALALLLAACSRPAHAPAPPHRDDAPGSSSPSWESQPEVQPPAEAPALTPLREAPLTLDPGPAPASLELHPVIAGPCPWLDVSLVGDQAFIHGLPAGDLARVLPDGALEPIRIPAAVSGRRGRDERIDLVDGRWPDDLWVRFADDVTRLMKLSDLKRPTWVWRRNGTWSSPADPRGSGPIRAWRMYPWRGDRVLVELGGLAPTFLILGDGELRPLRLADLAPAPIERCVHRPATVRIFDGGELLVVGAFCRRPETADAWDLVAARGTEERSIVDALPHPPGAWSGHHRVAAASPTAIHVAADFRAGPGPAHYTTLTSFDGAGWSLPAVFEGELLDLTIGPDGAPWVVAGHIIHRRAPDGAWERLVPSERLAVAAVAELDGALAWLRAAGGGLWLRPAGGNFVRVPVETTTSRVRMLEVKIREQDVWVAGEVQAGEHLHRVLLRNGPAGEVRRCRAP